jgi:hypothetical protein
MTNNKQQTAVDWLIEQLHYKYGGTDFFWTNMDEIEQAKEMDKEQKIRDFTDGYLYRGEQLRPWLIDKWYNETYGDDKQ